MKSPSPIRDSAKYGSPVRVYVPFMEMNCVYDNTRLKEELGTDLPNLPKFTDYMNEMFAMIDPNLLISAKDEK